METLFTILCTAAGTLGGWEAVKYLLHRGQNNRIKEAEADGAEFSLLREHIQFLQEQLTAKEKRFCEQTDRLRTVQDDYTKLAAEKSRIELELQRYRCVVPKCLKREPQNGY